MLINQNQGPSIYYAIHFGVGEGGVRHFIILLMQGERGVSQIIMYHSNVIIAVSQKAFWMNKNNFLCFHFSVYRQAKFDVFTIDKSERLFV